MKRLLSWFSFLLIDVVFVENGRVCDSGLNQRHAENWLSDHETVRKNKFNVRTEKEKGEDQNKIRMEARTF